MSVMANRNAHSTGLLFVVIVLSTGLAGYKVFSRLTKAKSADAHANTVITQETAQSAYSFTESIGINTHLNYYDRLYGNFSLVRSKLSILGVHHLRDGAQLLSDDYNQEMYGRWVQLGSIGIHFNAILDPRGSVKLATPETLRKIVELSHHLVESFEGPNELDLSGGDNWIGDARSFQAEIYHSVKDSSDLSQIAVIAPSMAFITNGVKVGDLSAICDYGNLHSYPAGELPTTVFPEQPDLARNIYGQRPVIMTESGYHNAFGDHKDQPAISENAAAKYVSRLFLENYNHGVVRTYLYELFDELPDPGAEDHELHWGLVRNDGSEKPAFVSLANFIALLNDGTPTTHSGTLEYGLAGDTTGIHHLLLQKHDGRFYLVLWHEVTSYNTRLHTEVIVPPRELTLILTRPVGTASIYYPMQGVDPANKLSNVSQLRLSVPDHPVIVELRFDN